MNVYKHAFEHHRRQIQTHIGELDDDDDDNDMGCGLSSSSSCSSHSDGLWNDENDVINAHQTLDNDGRYDDDVKTPDEL